MQSAPSTPAMNLSDAEITNLAKQCLDIYNQGNLDLIDDYFSPNLIRYINNDMATGLNALKKYVITLRTSYPDLNIKINELIIKDNRCVMLWSLTGTNMGALDGLPPTGKTIESTGVNIYRIDEGKIIEERIFFDNSMAMRMLGFHLTHK